MDDDDIQYLGSRRNPHVDLATGITLHVESSADVPACDLTFTRTDASVIHIGRRPTNDHSHKILEHNGKRALFRCAVVSRKHAKIAFSDSGTVYIIDMGSHHGTYIRKPGETVSKILKPETPTQLADGDLLTFGKVVGKNNNYVRPVVARVLLNHDLRPEPIFKPITPLKPLHIDLTKSPPPRRSNSGRYGVYVPASTSDEDDDDDMSRDSDIQEIPPSGSNPASGPNALPLKYRIIETFESNRPTHPKLLRLSPSAPLEDAPSEDESSQSNEADQYDSISSPILDSPRYSPFSPSPYILQSPLPDVTGSPYSSPRVHHYWEDNFDPAVKHAASLSLEDEEAPEEPNLLMSRANSPFPLVQPSGDASSKDPVDRSRSTSPMDLASPSPVINSIIDLPLEEPSIIGGWPGSPSPPSPAPQAEGELVVEEEPLVESPLQSAPGAMSLDAICSSEPSPQPQAQEQEAEESNKELTPTTTTPLKPSEDQVEIEDDVAPAPPPPAAETTQTATTAAYAELSALKTSLEKLQVDVAKLQTDKRKYRLRFNDNFHILTDRLRAMDDRVGDVSAQYSGLAERVDGAAEVDIPELQAQVEGLREMVEGLGKAGGAGDEEESEEEKERQEVKLNGEVRESVEILRELVAEMRNLKEATHKHMTAELDAVRVARDEALATIREHVEKQTSAVSPSPVSLRLKRKREDDGDDEEEADGAEPEDRGQDQALNDDALEADVTMADTTISPPFKSTSTPAVTPLNLEEMLMSIDLPSPPRLSECCRSGSGRRERTRKRARRIAAVAVQTATAVTVGAIATWSALAFS